MPNWCNNYAEIHGPKAVINQLHAAMQEGRFFGHMRPEPNYDEVDVLPTFPGIVGNNEPVKKESAWWDWRVQNWGTKWELGEDELQHNFTIEEGDTDYAVIKGSFDTAWSPACDAFQFFADSNEGVEVTVYYYEPGMGFCGIYDTQGGDDYYDITGQNSESVKDLIPETLDEMFGISESMAEYEEMDKDEVQTWYEDGVEKHGLEPHR